MFAGFLKNVEWFAILKLPDEKKHSKPFLTDRAHLNALTTFLFLDRDVFAGFNPKFNDLGIFQPFMLHVFEVFTKPKTIQQLKLN